MLEIPSSEPGAAVAAVGRDFLIGYGSLMNSQSRAKTVPTATAFPAMVSGYNRVW